MKFNEKIANIIQVAVAAGANMSDAAKSAGVSRMAVFKWERLGKLHADRNESTEFRSFYVGMTAAKLIRAETRKRGKFDAEGANRLMDWVESLPSESSAA